MPNKTFQKLRDEFISREDHLFAWLSKSLWAKTEINIFWKKEFLELFCPYYLEAWGENVNYLWKIYFFFIAPLFQKFLLTVTPQIQTHWLKLYLPRIKFVLSSKYKCLVHLCWNGCNFNAWKIHKYFLFYFFQKLRDKFHRAEPEDHLFAWLSKSQWDNIWKAKNEINNFLKKKSKLQKL